MIYKKIPSPRFRTTYTSAPKKHLGKPMKMSSHICDVSLLEIPTINELQLKLLGAEWECI